MLHVRRMKDMKILEDLQRYEFKEGNVKANVSKKQHIQKVKAEK